jgi:hypothetical protein
MSMKPCNGQLIGAFLGVLLLAGCRAAEHSTPIELAPATVPTPPTPALATAAPATVPPTAAPTNVPTPTATLLRPSDKIGQMSIETSPSQTPILLTWQKPFSVLWGSALRTEYRGP